VPSVQKQPDVSKLPSSAECSERIEALRQEIKKLTAERRDLVLLGVYHERPNEKRRIDDLEDHVARLSVRAGDFQLLQGQALERESREREEEAAKKAAERAAAERKSFESVLAEAFHVDDVMAEFAGACAGLQAKIDNHIAEFPEMDTSKAAWARRLSGGASAGGVARPSPALTRSARAHGLHNFIAIPHEGAHHTKTLRLQLAEEASSNNV
jgi:hypothetical protein